MQTLRRQLASLLAAACGVLACSASAGASSELHFDLNSISTRISSNSTGDVFSENFTGSLRLGHDDNSILAQVLIDGVVQPFDSSRSDGDGWALSHFSSKINIENGLVIGGYIYLEVESFTDGESDGETNTYAADIIAGLGRVNEQAGQGYTIDGITINGMFSDATFAGIDIMPWFALQPLIGSFINFSFDPGDDPFGVDENSHIDIFVTVPLPGSVVLGLSGVTFLTILRRRRFTGVENCVHSTY